MMASSFLLVRAARLVIARSARSLGQIAAICIAVAQPRKHRVLVGADHHDAIARRIDIRRRDSRQDRRRCVRARAQADRTSVTSDSIMLSTDS